MSIQQHPLGRTQEPSPNRKQLRIRQGIDDRLSQTRNDLVQPSYTFEGHIDRNGRNDLASYGGLVLV